MEVLRGTLTHAVIEVIDVRSAQLLASVSHPVADVMRGEPLLPQRLFRNEMTGYVYQVGEDGIPYVKILEGALEKR